MKLRAQSAIVILIKLLKFICTRNDEALKVVFGAEDVNLSPTLVLLFPSTPHAQIKWSNHAPGLYSLKPVYDAIKEIMGPDS